MDDLKAIDSKRLWENLHWGIQSQRAPKGSTIVRRTPDQRIEDHNLFMDDSKVIFTLRTNWTPGIKVLRAWGQNWRFENILRRLGKKWQTGSSWRRTEKKSEVSLFMDDSKVIFTLIPNLRLGSLYKWIYGQKENFDIREYFEASWKKVADRQSLGMNWQRRSFMGDLQTRS